MLFDVVHSEQLWHLFGKGKNKLTERISVHLLIFEISSVFSVKSDPYMRVPAFCSLSRVFPTPTILDVSAVVYLQLVYHWDQS